LRTVQRWVERAGGKRLDRVDWRDHSSAPGRTGRIDRAIEDVILEVRQELKEQSVLGEYGAVAVHRRLAEKHATGELALVPSVRTIGRTFERRGVLDARRRVRRPAPPPGWYLPELAARRVELDSFDVIDGLRLKGGRDIEILTGISLHGGLTGAWPEWAVTTSAAMVALEGHWREHGLPGFAQFDNDTRFHGSHGYVDLFGRLVRMCLSLDVVPVFAPVQETGFQASIESFNGRWQDKVWRRIWSEGLIDLREHSDHYIAATHARSAVRIEAAPERAPFPDAWEFDPRTKPAGRLVYLRRTTDSGAAQLLGRKFEVDRHWVHRLVRSEVDLSVGRVRFYALRRRDPGDQPLLREYPYEPLVRRIYRRRQGGGNVNTPRLE
jgi:hypothetical protein